MATRTNVLWLVAACAAVCGQSGAGFTFTASTNPANWQVGKTETVSVWLDSESFVHPLVFVGITAEFNASLLGEAQAVTAGEIVPSPTWQPSDFLSFTGPGVVDASFATESAQPEYLVQSAGRFARFEVTPQAAGSGELRFTFAQAMYRDPASGDLVEMDLETPKSMLFTVQVPSPGVLGLTACAAAGLMRRRNGHR